MVVSGRGLRGHTASTSRRLGMQIEKEKLLRAYRDMCTIREF